VGDGAPKKRATSSNNSSNWKKNNWLALKKKELMFKDIARSKVKKNWNLLTSPIEKGPKNENEINVLNHMQMYWNYLFYI
jgi:hypothetical protein